MPRAPACSGLGVWDLEQALLVERHHAEQFVAEGTVPGVEVHRDRDITWVVHPGQAWRNAGIMVRFSASSAERRLDTLLARYQRHGLEIRLVVDVAEYEKTPHPAIGPLTTPLRRVAFERLRTLVSGRSGRTRAFVAWLKGTPVGAIEIFLGSGSAGIHGLTVIDGYEGKGIGSALIEHACTDAARSRAKTMVLLASTEGQRLYQRRGFTEVDRFGYWYRSFQRLC